MKLYVVLSLLILTGTLLFAGCIGFEGSQSNPKTKEAFSLDSGYVSEEYAIAHLQMSKMHLLHLMVERYL